MGLAPYTANPALKERNFMWQLKNNGYIDQLVFSVYLQMKVGNSTHIKFGGFDEEGIKSGKASDLVFLKTKDVGSWKLGLQTVKLGEEMVAIDNRLALFELAYPYIYVPMADFKLVAREINNMYNR